MNRMLIVLVCVCCTVSAQAQVPIKIHDTKTDASFRGIAIGSDGTVWLGGSNATLLKQTADQSWSAVDSNVPKTSDFRDIESTGPNQIVAMSAGPGENSFVLRSTDNGQRWQAVLKNPDEKGFFNAMDFNKDGYGALVGDPIDGLLTVFITSDGGKTWTRTAGPQVINDEYGFAASGTNVVVDESRQIGIITGGSRSQYYVRQPNSSEWTQHDLGIHHGAPSAGAFSVAFAGDVGIAIGGDYKSPELDQGNVVITRDGGRSWKAPNVSMPHKACVLSLGGKHFVACGRTGVAVTTDAGVNWQHICKESFYTMDRVLNRANEGHSVWLAGADGRAALMTLDEALRNE